MTEEDADLRENIENTVTDLVSDFLYYARKEDEELPRGAIEKAIRTGTINTDEIVELLKSELLKGLAS
jgi:hypothetical protein